MKKWIFAFAGLLLASVLVSLRATGQIVNISTGGNNTWTGLQSFSNATQVTYNPSAGAAASYPAYTLQVSNNGSGVSYIDSIGPTGVVGSYDFRQVSPGAGIVFDSWSSDTSGNWTAHGNVTVKSGANTVVRCTTAGTLPIGALTINAASCGASSDTGLRVN